MANFEHVEIVWRGAEAIAAWRESHPGWQLDLREADLRDANLQRADLRDANLQRADLRDAKLQDADLQDANLRDANLQRADLQRASLQGADLRRADLRRADFQRADLRDAKLQDADLQDANLRDANLRRADLQRASLQRADLRRADFQRANLQRADLRRADFQRANLQRADLRNTRLQYSNLNGVNFDQAFLDGADLTTAYFNRQTRFNDISISGETKGLGAWVFNPDKYIIREIEFPPEYRQAGIGIMNYFAEVMRQKYPDVPATVQITQDDVIVRMTIETDDGHREIVEKTLEEYGLVVAEKMVPAVFLSGEYERMALENKLEMTKMELRMTQQLLQISERQHEQRIGSLESEISHLREQQNRAPTLDEAIREVRGLVGEALLPARGSQLAQLFQQQLSRSAAQDDEIRDALTSIQHTLQSIMDRHEAHAEELEP